MAIYKLSLKKDSKLPVVQLHRNARSLYTQGGILFRHVGRRGIQGGGGIERGKGTEGMVFVLGRGGQWWTFEKTMKTCTDQHSKKHLRRTNMS